MIEALDNSGVKYSIRMKELLYQKEEFDLAHKFEAACEKQRILTEELGS